MINAKFRMQNLLPILCISHFAFCIAACSIPSLESQQCAEARDSVKDFYSWYLGTDAKTRTQQQTTYDRFIAPGFQTSATDDLDPFFLSPTMPTTFKIGKCDVDNDSRVSIQVQLYWRYESKTDQKEVYAEVARSGDKWLIEKVASR